MSNNVRRNNNSSCGPSNQQFEPYMLGSSRGFKVGNPMPQTVSVNTPVSAPPQQYNPSMKTSSMNNANVSVRDCMQWPNSLNSNRNASQPAQSGSYSSNQQTGNSGEFGYCEAPPKVYISGPGGKDKRQQNFLCQVAPFGTDPTSMIKPMQPLTVRVQAPADLFTGDPSQPKTISISPHQLYGGR